MELEGEVDVLTCSGDDVTVLAAEGPELESSREGEVVGKLDRAGVLPHVHQIILGPAVWKTLITHVICLSNERLSPVLL